MIEPICSLPSLDGYLPMTAPKGPLIFLWNAHTLFLCQSSSTMRAERGREGERQRERNEKTVAECVRVCERSPRVLRFGIYFNGAASLSLSDFKTKISLKLLIYYFYHCQVARLIYYGLHSLATMSFSFLFSSFLFFSFLYV